MSHYLFNSIVYENFGKLNVILILKLSKGHKAISFIFKCA